MRPITFISVFLAFRTNARPLRFDLPIWEIFKDPNPSTEDNPYGPLEVHSDRGNGIHHPGDFLHLDDTWPDFVSAAAVRRADPAVEIVRSEPEKVSAMVPRYDEDEADAIVEGVQDAVDAAVEITANVLGAVALGKRSVADHPVHKRDFIQFLISLFTLRPGPEIMEDDGLPQQTIEKRSLSDSITSFFNPKRGQDETQNQNQSVDFVTLAPEQRDIGHPVQKRDLASYLLSVFYPMPEPGDVDDDDNGPNTLDTKKRRSMIDDITSFFALTPKPANDTATTATAAAPPPTKRSSSSTPSTSMPFQPRTQWSYAKGLWENEQLRAIDPITGEVIPPSQDRKLLEPIDPTKVYGYVEVELPANPTQADLLCQQLEGFEKLIMLLAYFGCPKK